MELHDRSSVDIYGNCNTEYDKIVRREWLSTLNSRKNTDTDAKKIGRNDDRSFDFSDLKYTLPSHDNHMVDLMKNDYLRKSIEMRIQRKALLQQF